MQVQDVVLLPAFRLLAVGIGCALVANCLTLLFRPALIGRGGERAVRLALARLGLPALHDVVLADALGHTQIDHLVRTTQGIVVIETKTFSGWITGTLYSAGWTQHLAGGRIRHRFQNPVRQNHRHCKAVEAAIIGLTVPVHGRIVSAGRARFCEALEVVPIPWRWCRSQCRRWASLRWTARGWCAWTLASWTRPGRGWRPWPAGRPSFAVCTVRRCGHAARRSWC